MCFILYVWSGGQAGTTALCRGQRAQGIGHLDFDSRHLSQLIRPAGTVGVEGGTCVEGSRASKMFSRFVQG